MKLQSQVTRRFERAELQRLAKASRPRKPPGLIAWIAAGATLGFSLVGLFRLL